MSSGPRQVVCRSGGRAGSRKPSGSTSEHTLREDETRSTRSCAFRIWKISSCLRMPVAPPTARSLGDLRELLNAHVLQIGDVQPLLGPAPAGGALGGGAFGCSGMALVSVGVAASVVVVPLPVRPGPGTSRIAWHEDSRRSGWTLINSLYGFSPIATTLQATIGLDMERPGTGRSNASLSAARIQPHFGNTFSARPRRSPEVRLSGGR